MLKDVARSVNWEILKLIEHQKMAVAMKELSALINVRIPIGDHLPVIATQVRLTQRSKEPSRQTMPVLTGAT